MLNVIAGEALTVPVAFLVDGEYVSPDASSVTYSLRDNAGVLVPTATDVAVTLASGATEAFISISALLNTKTLTTEMRTLVVKFTVGSHPHQVMIPYRLNSWLNINVTPVDVRNCLGVSRGELPDEDVDLYSAYYVLDDALGSNLLATALASGTIQAQFANDAIIFKAAHDLIPSMPGRMTRKQADGTTSFERFPRFDFASLQKSLASLIEEAVAQISSQASSYPGLLVGGSRTDPVTNA